MTSMKYTTFEALELEVESLRQQLATLKAEIKSIGKAIDDPRTDLTMTMSEVIIDQKQQLHAAQADNIRLREALDYVVLQIPEFASVPGIEEALAATADLNELILCEKEPFARKISYGSLVFLEGYAELSEGTPLYRAWEPKT